ncbi:hypothetical protein CKO25_11075 [Thiocapsa imhoffii]|uniref:Uncharacterized protein n=1 Tax=Thiocapsa imhoffii TaxID=382777 RepID=A0A9X0WIH0_9GAMM|nr:hypothetical protein [Thiocapsa imhoffii]
MTDETGSGEVQTQQSVRDGFMVTTAPRFASPALTMMIQAGMTTWLLQPRSHPSKRPRIRAKFFCASGFIMPKSHAGDRIMVVPFWWL